MLEAAAALFTVVELVALVELAAAVLGLDLGQEPLEPQTRVVGAVVVQLQTREAQVDLEWSLLLIYQPSQIWRRLELV
jgi:hypothetical protein